jgi:hypothetical protein
MHIEAVESAIGRFVLNNVTYTDNWDLERLDQASELHSFQQSSGQCSDHTSKHKSSRQLLDRQTIAGGKIRPCKFTTGNVRIKVNVS